MGSKSRKFSMDETDGTRASSKMDDHKALIQKFLDKGYTMESQETTEENGLDHELVCRILTTVLNSPNSDIPHIKFEAKELYGKYNYHEKVFEPYDFPRFKVDSFTKSADIRSHNDPWMKFDVEE